MGALTHLEEEVGPRARRHIVPLLTKGSTARDSRAPRCFLRALKWSYIRRGARSSCCIVASSADWGLWRWSLASVPRFGFWLVYWLLRLRADSGCVEPLAELRVSTLDW